MHFKDQLPKFMNISSLIDVFVLISQPTDYFIFFHADIQCTEFLYKWFIKCVLSLQVIVEIGNDCRGFLK